MNNRELENLLKKNSLPKPPAGYWENFPKKIAAKIQWQRPEEISREAETPGKRNVMAVAWGIGMATACVALAFWFGFSKGRDSVAPVDQLASAKKYFREIEVMFPNQVRAIIFEENGAQLVLSEKADVPASPPLWVKICDGKSCASAVTFSGQELQIVGQRFEVLADAQGKVILIGDKLFWSDATKPQATGQWRVQARSLNYSL